MKALLRDDRLLPIFTSRQNDFFETASTLHRNLTTANLLATKIIHHQGLKNKIIHNPLRAHSSQITTLKERQL